MIPLLRISNGGYQHSQMIQHAPLEKKNTLDVARRKLKLFQPTFPSLNQMFPNYAHHLTSSISLSCFNNCHRSSAEVVRQTNKTLWPISLTRSTVIDMACTSRMLVRTTTIGACYNGSSRMHSNLRTRPNMDQLSLTKNLMCLGRNAVGFLSDYHRSRSQICVNACAAPRRHDITSHMASPLQHGPTAAAVNESLVFARNLGDSPSPNERGNEGQPSWG